MSRKKKGPASRKPAAKKPAKKGGGPKGPQQRKPTTVPKKQREEQLRRQERRWLWARRLWAVVTALLIAALLFESTMIFTIGMGIYMLSVPEFIGLWFVAGGYVLACLPWAFGLLIATGQFWRSMTHSLWIGLIYGTVGFLFLDQILAAL